MAWEERASPFTHWVADGLTEVGPAASESLSAWYGPRSGWVHYDNDVERKKWAHPDPHALGPAVSHLFSWLCCDDFVGALSILTGVEGLRADPTLHGAGVHIVEPGGWLSPHLDYARHPRLPDMERRVNLILFLTGGSESDGGAFELYDDECRTALAQVAPKAGRAVVWCPGDVEYHGTGRLSDQARPRVAAAVYYLAPARPGCVRKRALFCPNRGS